MEAYQISTGLKPEKEDKRDYQYADVMGSMTEEKKVDWDRGYDVFEDVGLKHIVVDQRGSLSCVGQSAAMLTRSWLHKMGIDSSQRSAKFIYAQIRLQNGGAFLRDGVKIPATIGSVTEETLPSSENGRTSEEFMKDFTLTPELKKTAKPFDKFNYRMIPGDTSDIDIYAHAIRNNVGVLGGLTGTNEGFIRHVVRPPQPGERKWGHAMYYAAFGRLDMEWSGIPKGTKCIFTPNSWGGRYTITGGRWRGYQAIPESYFKASAMTAVGEVDGIYSFNSWVLVPDEVINEEQKIMDLIKRSENKIIQLTEAGVEGAGSMALVADGRVLEISSERAAQAALTALIRNGYGVPVNKETWDNLNKEQF